MARRWLYSSLLKARKNESIMKERWKDEGQDPSQNEADNC